MLNLSRRALLTGAAALLAAPAMPSAAFATPAEAEYLRPDGYVGYGLDAFSNMVDGKVELSQVQTLVLAKWDVQHVRGSADALTLAVQNFPKQSQLLAHSQRWNAMLKQLEDDGTLVIVNRRNFGHATWCSMDGGKVFLS